ncbi:M56 family metallopeptidase [Qipengyuania sp. SM2507]
MTQYLLDTLMWTGALIALVLLLRRPVARHFGAQAAYALWALPLLRLAIPPITLPAWLKPAEAAPSLAEAATSEPAPMLAMNSLAQAGEIAQVSPLPAAASVPPVDWLTPLLVLWLAGSGIFLARRFALYFAMRRELLEGAKPVGEVGRVRLVETPATRGPVAFGVFDKVVALPQGFMAQRDRRTRDLAIAHELAHHRGHDLLANVVVQPLFALHWFNPLGWAGWTALRRDQEAACDARVVAVRSRDERAAYADIIAGFATTAGAAPRLALAAPMACAVLGDKSIIHRLRSLTMADISPRRRFAGRALLAGAALALPLTASISYAETISPEAPAVPTAPQAPTAPPAPNAPPATPAPPAPPAPPVEPELNIDLTIEREVETRVERELDAAEAGLEAAERHVLRTREHGMTAQERAELRADMAQLRRDLAEGGELRREIRLAVSQGRAAAPEVVMTCQQGQTEIVRSGTTGAGREALFVCEAAALETARAAIDSARRTIRSDRNLSEAERAEALRSLDEALAEIRSEG